MAKFPHHSIPVYSILSNSYGELGKLCQHSAWLCELEEKLITSLDPPLNLHCRVANYEDNTLTLHTDSSAWAAKLRFIIPDILQYIRDNCHMKKIKTVRIRVAVSTIKPATPIKRLSVSQSTSIHLEKVALSMTDEGLRQSLLRLSEHRS